MTCQVQVAQRVAKRRGIAQKGGKKQKQRDRVYLEYPSSPVMPEEGGSSLNIAGLLLHCISIPVPYLCHACMVTCIYTALHASFVHCITAKHSCMFWSVCCPVPDPIKCISFSKTAAGCMSKYSTLHMFSWPCRALLVPGSPALVHEHLGGGR